MITAHPIANAMMQIMKNTPDDDPPSSGTHKCEDSFTINPGKQELQLYTICVPLSC